MVVITNDDITLNKSQEVWFSWWKWEICIRNGLSHICYDVDFFNIVIKNHFFRIANILFKDSATVLIVQEMLCRIFANVCFFWENLKVSSWKIEKSESIKTNFVKYKVGSWLWSLISMLASSAIPVFKFSSVSRFGIYSKSAYPINGCFNCFSIFLNSVLWS